MSLQFGFVIFWRKDFGAKAAHKMLVKLTPGLIFTGEARARIRNASFSSLLSYVYNKLEWLEGSKLVGLKGLLGKTL